MKLRRKDGALEVEISWGYEGPFRTSDGVLEVPDDLGQEIVNNSGLYEIVIDKPKPAKASKPKAADEKEAGNGL